MSSPRTKWKSQQPRLRGRLGIDVASQSPAGVVLPPLVSQGVPGRSPVRHVSLVQQQHEELVSLQQALRQRIESTRALVDLSPLLESVRRAIETVHGASENRPEAEWLQDGSCFSVTKWFCSHLDQAPFLRAFLLNLVQQIERLVHARRQRESSTDARQEQTLLAPNDAHSTSSDSSGSRDGSSSDGGDNGPSSDEDGEVAGESNDRSVDTIDSSSRQSEETGDPNLRHARATRAVFRTTLRNRRFPPSRVSPHESIQRTTSHMPFDQLKRQADLASLRLKGHDTLGSAQWSVVLFPKRRPSLSSQDELAAFVEWAETKQTILDAHRPHSKQCEEDSSEQIFEQSCLHFKATLELKELIGFEFSRFVFDKCPTTSRFLHRLFVELVEVALLTLANAEREHQIIEQRHKNVHLELSRLNEKLTTVQDSLTAVEDTLTKRQQMLLRERELIIRKRKKLNLLLGSDQILIRRVAGLIALSQEIGDDVLQNTKISSVKTVSTLADARAGQQNDSACDSVERFEVLDEIVSTFVDKYRHLPQVERTRAKEITSPGYPASHNDHPQPDDKFSTSREFIVLDANGIKNALDEYKATLTRLSRMISARSPDSSIGWEGQELWDQALFIPPHEEIQDLERDVQRLSLLVEDHILSKRLQRSRRDAVSTVGVQTDISACTQRAGHQNQRWRAKPFAQHAPTSSAAPTRSIKTWNWRQLPSKKRSATIRTEFKSSSEVLPSKTEDTPKLTEHLSIREDDHRDLLRNIVPDGFRAFIRSIPSDYVPQPLDLNQVHNLISYLFNGIWMLVQEDFHRPPRFSTNSRSRGGDEARLIPLTTLHEYIYRVFLQHFHVESVVTGRILDFLLSASRLDTQSCKVQLFCKLLGLSGVATFPSDGFWFALKALHVLQRCCASSGGYFLLDGEGDNEFIPQASAAEALGQLFSGCSNEVLKRIRQKLFGLASVYGAVWIPVYNVLTFIMDEWKAGQDALQQTVEEKLFLEHASEMDPFTGNRVFCNEGNIVSFSDFLRGFHILKLHVNQREAVQAYRQLLVDSAAQTSNATTLPGGPNIDRHRFYVNWMQMILHAVNVSQQQMLQSPNSQSSSTLGASNGPNVQLGAISDAMIAAHQNLSFKFLVASWDQMRPEIIRRLDSKFNDVGLQVRLVQQMQTIIAKQKLLSLQQRDGNAAWRSFHQLIEIAYTNATPRAGSNV